MGIRNWFFAGLLLFAAPAWIGSIWSYFAGIQEKVKRLLFSWVTGFLTIMAASQLILVPLVLKRYDFADYVKIISLVYLGLMFVALLINIRCVQSKNAQRNMACQGMELIETVAPEKDGITKEPYNRWQILCLIGALGLILLQAAVAGFFQHIDEDDSRFVAEAVIAVEHGTMFKESPVTGRMMYEELGEVRKDMTSPWPMMVAYWSDLSDIAPAAMSHKYMPFYLILLTYAVYALLGMQFFPQDREKVSIFLIFVSALHLFGYFSTHTTSAVFLLRIWQGKALVGAMLIPMIFFIMIEIMNGSGKKLWYFLGAVTAMAASLASASGITIAPLAIGMCSVAEVVHTRKIKKGLLMLSTAIPGVIYLLCYLFFWKLVKIYY